MLLLFLAQAEYTSGVSRVAGVPHGMEADSEVVSLDAK